jgi:hypothetical protein
MTDAQKAPRDRRGKRFIKKPAFAGAFVSASKAGFPFGFAPGIYPLPRALWIFPSLRRLYRRAEVSVLPVPGEFPRELGFADY